MTSHRRQILRQMRGVARIVDAHRSDALSQHDTDPPASPDLPPRTELAAHRPVRDSRMPARSALYIEAGIRRSIARSRSNCSDPTATAARRPLEEARHLARIRHSNVVTVYGADRDGDECGIWMEYIEGQHAGATWCARAVRSARARSSA